MASLISQCTLRGNFRFLFPITLDKIITATTTPEEFDIERAKHPSYQLIDVGLSSFTSLHIAAQVGNVPLIEYIIRIGGKILLNVGTEKGKTALVCALENYQPAAVITLIALGSDVNMTYKQTDTEYSIRLESSIDSELGGQCQNAYNSTSNVTPLSFVVQRQFDKQNMDLYRIQEVQQLAMVKILLMHGAVARPQVSEEGTQVLQKAKTEILQEELAIIVPFMPHELVKIIADYVPLNEFLEPIPSIDPL